MAVFKYKNVKNVEERTEITVEGHLRPLVDFFVSGGGGEGAAPVTRDKLRHIFTSYPPVLVYDIDTRVKPVVDFLRELGSEDPIRCVPSARAWIRCLRGRGERASVERKNAAAALTNGRPSAPRALDHLCVARVIGWTDGDRIGQRDCGAAISPRPRRDDGAAADRLVFATQRLYGYVQLPKGDGAARPGPRPADARVRPNPTRAG